jgi:hypothetical protein
MQPASRTRLQRARRTPQGNAEANKTNLAADAGVSANKIKELNFSKYADINLLGDGEAKQKLRKFEDDLQVAAKKKDRPNRLSRNETAFRKGIRHKN